MKRLSQRLTLPPWGLLPPLWLLRPSSCSILLPSLPLHSGILNPHSLSLLIHNVNAHLHSQDSQIYGPFRTSPLDSRLIHPTQRLNVDVSQQSQISLMFKGELRSAVYILPLFCPTGEKPLHPPRCSGQKCDSLVDACLLLTLAWSPSPSPVSSTSKVSLKPAHFSPSPVPHRGQTHLSPAHLQPPPNGPLCFPSSRVPLSIQQPECSCKIVRWDTSLLCLKPSSVFPLHLE